MAEVDELTVEECLSLLETKKVGRIGLATPSGQQILPVNYVVSQDEKIVFRTVPYGAIANSAHDADVAFEVDEIHEHDQSGWSVLAVGRCHRISDPDQVHVLRQREDPEPWADGQRILYFEIDWTALSGRKVAMPAGSPVPTARHSVSG